jgi:hypothetical protein
MSLIMRCRRGLIVAISVSDAAISRLKLAAKIAGLLVLRHEIDQPGELARMTDAGLNQVLFEQFKALGLSERSLVEIRASVFAK